MLTENEMQTLDMANAGDGQRLFLEGMIKHHVGAIEMAHKEVRDGQHPGLVELAKHIAENQQQEIKVMTGLLRQNLKESVVRHPNGVTSTTARPGRDSGLDQLMSSWASCTRDVTPVLVNTLRRWTTTVRGSRAFCGGTRRPAGDALTPAVLLLGARGVLALPLSTLPRLVLYGQDVLDIGG